MTADAFPRALTERERSVLTFVLSIDDPRLAPLRGQAEVATVVGRCDCGCASIEIGVDQVRAVAVTGLCSPVIDVASPPGETYPDPHYCELILFLRAGWLSYLEVVFYGGDPVREFPPPDRFDPPTMRC